MALEQAMKQQIREIFSALFSEYTLKIEADRQHPNRDELVELLQEVAECSPKISCVETPGTRLVVNILKDGIKTGIAFRGIPSGHEFTSLLLAILNADGKGKNLPDQTISKRISALKGNINLSTYVSLSCTNCPEVVQSLNIMSVINPNITHEMVDGGIYESEVEALKLQGVPAVFANGELLHVGLSNIGNLLKKLEEMFGTEASDNDFEEKEYDLLVLGGGPSGCSAAIYAARKGLKTAIITDRIGGQVKETVGIENLISTPKTTGNELAANLHAHIRDYPIDIYDNRTVAKVTINNDTKNIITDGGEKFKAPYMIVATGASWRKLNIEGEDKYIGHGVAFCPHCDGPFYKDKNVAVIGGGNSGVEAALDLAGICHKVTIIEFLPELRADNVLQDKARQQPNIEILTSKESISIEGDGKKVTGIRIKDRQDGQEQTIALDGIFVQIGLSPNSKIVADLVELNKRGEIVIDEWCRTSVAGLYASGDVSSVPYKQIVIAMGEGAKASLSMFDDKIRGVVKA